jgi:HD-like signal output (HDOD) protein
VVERGDFVVTPYPAAAMRLRSLIESNKFGLSQIAEAAAADPALAAALLRIANSPVYRVDGPALTTLPRAVNRLGARAVSSLALTAGLAGLACAAGPLSDVKYRVWRRSITCALSAQRLAAARNVDPEVAFLAGLLHGFGRSVALACIEGLITTSREAHTVSEWLSLVEEHRAPLAERVARAWQLPDSITDAMTVVGATGNATTALVALADAIAGALDRGLGARGIGAELSLEPKLVTLLTKFIDHLPGALEAFIQAPDDPKNSARTPAAVNKPTRALSGQLRPLAVQISDLRKGAPEKLECVGMAPIGFVVTSGRPLQEASVIRLRLHTEPVIEAWFTVLLCIAERQRYRIELQTFAPSDDLRERLAALWAGAPPALPPLPQ